MQHLDEGTIHAWLDGELPSAEREAVEAHIASCEQCAAAVAEARGFVAASSRILLALDAVPGGVLPAPSQTSSTAAARGPARFSVSRMWMAVAAVLVLSTVSVIATRSGSDAPLAKLEEARAPRSGAPVIAASPTPAPAATAPAGAVAASPAEESASDSSAPRPMSRQQLQVASGRALEAADKTPPAVAAGKLDRVAQAPLPAPAARMDAKVQRDSSPVSALAAQAPKTAVADSGRKQPALMLSEVVVTGAGTTSTVEKLGSAVASNEAPQLLSRNTSNEAGDTVVTTVYAVRDGTVTLIERSTARDESRRARNSSFSDQVMSKARESTPINSISWSDSTGRTRTLRGAMTQAQLERIRAALFGATP
jgi:hypothetical protein